MSKGERILSITASGTSISLTLSLSKGERILSLTASGTSISLTLSLSKGERIEPEGNVVGQRVREQERLLRHEADGAAEHGERHLAHVDAVDEHAARRRIVKAREQRNQRRLA